MQGEEASPTTACVLGGHFLKKGGKGYYFLGEAPYCFIFWKARAPPPEKQKIKKKEKPNLNLNLRIRY
jgi:hypothetical protein